MRSALQLLALLAHCVLLSQNTSLQTKVFNFPVMFCTVESENNSSFKSSCSVHTTNMCMYVNLFIPSSRHVDTFKVLGALKSEPKAELIFIPLRK